MSQQRYSTLGAVPSEESKNEADRVYRERIGSVDSGSVSECGQCVERGITSNKCASRETTSLGAVAPIVLSLLGADLDSAILISATAGGYFRLSSSQK